MNSDDKIKTGDVVTLKSGGPPMTVGQMGPLDASDMLDAPLAAGECVCAWFPVLACTSMVKRDNEPTYYGSCERGVFHVDMLKRVETGPSELRAAADAVYTSLIDHGEVEPHKVTLLGRALAKEVS